MIIGSGVCRAETSRGSDRAEHAERLYDTVQLQVAALFEHLGMQPSPPPPPAQFPPHNNDDRCDNSNKFDDSNFLI
ncbi:hypothetical protein ACLB2K_013428 [Fragaria x ananassa]